jgi:hypothetical protein
LMTGRQRLLDDMPTKKKSATDYKNAQTIALIESTDMSSRFARFVLCRMY